MKMNTVSEQEARDLQECPRAFWKWNLHAESAEVHSRNHHSFFSRIQENILIAKHCLQN